MSQPDWDDERLAAAFHDRFDHPAPPTLIRAVQAAIAGTAPTRFHAFERFQARHVATAAVAVVLVGALAVALTDIGRLGGGPSTPAGSGFVPSPGASATPTAQAIPGLEFETLPIIQVSDALAVRDSGVDDRELAVLGWFTPPRPVSCGPVPTAQPAPRAAHVSPVQLVCPDEITWLTQERESLVHVTGDRTDGSIPQGPALNPDLDGLDSSWWPDLPESGIDGDSAPIDVVFVGHFDDRRAVLCPEAEVDACRDRFVVDAVASVAGIPPALSVVRDAEPTSSIGDIEAIIANEAPGSPILSMVVTTGGEGLARIEPTLAYRGGGLLIPSVLWVVRVLEGDRATTYFVVDGTDRIFEVSQEGEAIQVGGSTADPAVTPGPWPPEDAVIVPLTSQVEAGKPSVQVAVVDESSRLVNATEKGTVDPSTQSFDGRLGAYGEPGLPGRVHLTWVGGICDSHITVTVAADLGSITFDMGPPPANCDSIGVGRELVLDFDGPIDVTAIALIDVADGPVPVATSPAYQLDCGPLGPDTCERRVAGVIAANPTKRVVSIAFSDECGSYTVLFDDGTGVSASVDCVLP